MAVSCREVMYGAYYPYLYGRGAARSFHPAPHFQYDRFNVGAGSESYGASACAGGAALCGGGAGGAGGSTSSGAVSPDARSPPHAHLAHTHAPHAHAHSAALRTKEEDLSAHGRASADGGGSSESESECGAGGGPGGAGGAGGERARAQYVSANCVVFTHYSGDVAAVVDEHFTRALSLDKAKESVPLGSRNLPASFFNAAAPAGVPGAPGQLELYEYDPWHQHYGGYGHHAAAAHRQAAEYHAAHAHNMAAAGYAPLLLPRSVPQYKPEWAPHQHLDPNACSPYYPAVPGLEAQVQDTSKDLYWF